MKLKKRGKTYYIHYSYYDDKGEWQYARKSTGLSDEREAKRFMKAFETELLHRKIHQIKKEDVITVGDYRDEFLKTKKHLSKDTYRMYRMSLEFFIDSLDKKDKKPIRNISKTDFMTFSSILLSKGVMRESINSYLRHIRTYINAARDDDHIKKRIKIPFLKTGKPLPKTLTPEEIRLITDYASKNYPDMARIIKMALYTGLRRKEILSIRFQDIYKPSKDSMPVVRITGKGEKDRIVPLVPVAMDAIGDIKDIGPVFRQYHKDTVSHYFKAIVRTVGIDKAKFRFLRHSAATQMIVTGIPLEIIQKILGHSDISTTLIYAQIHNPVVQEHIKKLKY